MKIITRPSGNRVKVTLEISDRKNIDMLHEFSVIRRCHEIVLDSINASQVDYTCESVTCSLSHDEFDRFAYSAEEEITRTNKRFRELREMIVNAHREYYTSYPKS